MGFQKNNVDNIPPGPGVKFTKSDTLQLGFFPSEVGIEIKTVIVSFSSGLSSGLILQKFKVSSLSIKLLDSR